MSPIKQPRLEIDSRTPGGDPQMPEETEEEFFRKALEGHAEYERTGLHLTQEEVEEWMKKRARGERAPMPKLHT